MSLLKPEASIGTGLAVCAVVYAIHSNFTPSMADMQGLPAGNPDTDAAERKATWLSAGVVAGVSLLAKDPTIFVLGSAAPIALAWGAYTNQSYKKFTGATVSLVDLPIPGPGGAIVNGLLGFLPGAVPGVSTSIGVLDTVTKVGGAVTNTARWVSNPKNWVRVAYVIGGGILVYAAVESLILPYTTKAVGKVMGVVGPRGKVSKVAGAAKKLGEKANS
jgi:TRAP-type C4-dicarboxylate transport system permease small subunit